MQLYIHLVLQFYVIHITPKYKHIYYIYEDGKAEISPIGGNFYSLLNLVQRQLLQYKIFKVFHIHTQHSSVT